MSTFNNHSLSDQVRHELTCPICASVFIDSRSLECGHLFCVRCIFTLAAQTSSFQPSSRFLKCPLRCAKATQLIFDFDSEHRVEENNNSSNSDAASSSELLVSRLAHPESVNDRLLHLLVNGNSSCHSSTNRRELLLQLKSQSRINKRDQDIAQAVLNLPRNLTINNISIAIRKNEFGDSKNNQNNIIASSGIMCDICFETSSSSCMNSFCDRCGMIICQLCSSNSANDHGLFCSDKNNNNNNGDTGKSLAGIRPCMFTKTIALASALKNSRSSDSSSSSFPVTSFVDGAADNQKQSSQGTGFKSCHLDVLPFRCVTVKCQMKNSKNSTQQQQLQQQQNNPYPSCAEMYYRVWLRRGLKSKIEPFIPLVDQSSPEREMLYDLQVFLDSVSDVIRWIRNHLENNNSTTTSTKIKMTFADKVDREQSIHSLFLLRLCSAILFLLESIVVPFGRSFLVASSLAGCQWMLKIKKENVMKNKEHVNSSFYQSYLRRFLAHQEEYANETSRLIVAHVESLHSQISSLQKTTKDAYDKSVREGWSNDNEIGAVVKELENLLNNNTNDNDKKVVENEVEKKTSTTDDRHSSWWTQLTEKVEKLMRIFYNISSSSSSCRSNCASDFLAVSLPSSLQQDVDLFFNNKFKSNSSSSSLTKCWETLQQIPLYSLKTSSDCDDNDNDNDDDLSKKSMETVKEVVTLRQRHVRAMLEYSVKPERKSSLIKESKRKLEREKAKYQQQYNLLEEGGFEQSMIFVLSGSLDCQTTLAAEIAERATINVKIHHQQISSFDINKNNDYESRHHQQLKDEMSDRYVRNVSAALSSSAKKDEEELKIKTPVNNNNDHRLSRVDPTIVIPKSSTMITSSHRTLPSSFRITAEKLALQRFSIDANTVFHNFTNSSKARAEKKKKEKTNKKRKDAKKDDDVVDDDENDEEKENHFETNDSSNKEEYNSSSPVSSDNDDVDDENRTGKPFATELLDFSNDSEASTEFDQFSDDDEEDGNFFDDDDTSVNNDDDDDSSSSNSSVDVDVDVGNSDDAEQTEKKRTTPTKKRRSQEAKRIRLEEFPDHNFKTSFISHRIFHQPFVLTRLLPTTKSSRSKTVENDDGTEVVEEDLSEEDDDEKILLVDATTSKSHTLLSAPADEIDSVLMTNDDDGLVRRRGLHRHFEDLLDRMEEDDIEDNDDSSDDDDDDDNDNNMRPRRRGRRNRRRNINAANNEEGVLNNNDNNNTARVYPEDADDYEAVQIVDNRVSTAVRNNNNNNTSGTLVISLSAVHNFVRTSSCFWITNLIGLSAAAAVVVYNKSTKNVK